MTMFVGKIVELWLRSRQRVGVKTEVELVVAILASRIIDYARDGVGNSNSAARNAPCKDEDGGCSFWSLGDGEEEMVEEILEEDEEKYWRQRKIGV
ncbi:DUF2891 domain-containing protein [Sesbania bispinosa]|nr:DUF2891 domain-containing protein [Sesbania bispinosa]